MAVVLIPPQVLYGLPGTWTQAQDWLATCRLGGTTAEVSLGGGGTIGANGPVIEAVGSYFYAQQSATELGVPASQSNPTAASGAVYQNTTNRYLSIDLALYATTAGTDGTVAFARGATSTPTTNWTGRVPGGTAASKDAVFPLRIPPGFYWSVTLTGATIDTVTQIEE